MHVAHAGLDDARPALRGCCRACRPELASPGRPPRGCPCRPPARPPMLRWLAARPRRPADSAADATTCYIAPREVRSRGRRRTCFPPAWRQSFLPGTRRPRQLANVRRLHATALRMNTYYSGIAFKITCITLYSGAIAQIPELPF